MIIFCFCFLNQIHYPSIIETFSKLEIKGNVVNVIFINIQQILYFMAKCEKPSS